MTRLLQVPRGVVAVLTGMLFLLLFVVAPRVDAAGKAAVFPDVIPLPDGFRPEGVVMGYGTTLYSGSLGSGAVYEVNVRTGESGPLVEGQAGGMAVGLDFDRRSGYLFVSGGTTGTGKIYDTATGALVESYDLGPAGGSFINDVVVTREAAYFTNSFNSVLYRVPLSQNGEPAAMAETLPLGPDFPFFPGGFNANGIVATHNGEWLIVANSTAAAVYLVDPETGAATMIDVGQALPSADGLVLSGRTLYVVQNSLNQIAEIELGADLTTGVVTDVITDDDFRVPTTATRFGASLYAVNARFDTTPGPAVEYEIVKVRR